MKNENEELLRIAQEAVQHTHKICVLGSTNKPEYWEGKGEAPDLFFYAGWMLQGLYKRKIEEITNRICEDGLNLMEELDKTECTEECKNELTGLIKTYSKYTKEQEGLFSLKEDQKSAEKVRVGNCGYMSSIAALYLLNKGCVPLDLVHVNQNSLSDYHAFVLIDDKIICDPWAPENTGFVKKDDLKKSYPDLEVFAHFSTYPLPPVTLSEIYEKMAAEIEKTLSKHYEKPQETDVYRKIVEPLKKKAELAKETEYKEYMDGVIKSESVEVKQEKCNLYLCADEDDILKIVNNKEFTNETGSYFFINSGFVYRLPGETKFNDDGICVEEFRDTNEPACTNSIENIKKELKEFNSLVPVNDVLDKKQITLLYDIIIGNAWCSVAEHERNKKANTVYEFNKKIQGTIFGFFSHKNKKSSTLTERFEDFQKIEKSVTKIKKDFPEIKKDDMPPSCTIS